LNGKSETWSASCGYTGSGWHNVVRLFRDISKWFLAGYIAVCCLYLFEESVSMSKSIRKGRLSRELAAAEWSFGGCLLPVHTILLRFEKDSGNS
jgi:hypothetical protein